ncbi:MAG: hypothetical protein K0Q87_4777 [Neobacillus sp.]|jgi:type II secretory pathway component PulJ|nr:hypothetical protein [Neobacillus sp.]
MVAAMIGFFFILIVMVVVIIRRQLEKNKLSANSFDQSATRLQLQLEEAADVIIARMENHVNHLEFLIEEADNKIVELDHRIKTIEELSQKQLVFEKQVAVHHINDMNPVTNQAETIEKAVEYEVEVTKPMRPKFVLKDSALNTAVFDMLDKGCSLDQITKETGIGKGAIKLIKQMYKNKKLDKL